MIECLPYARYLTAFDIYNTPAKKELISLLYRPGYWDLGIQGHAYHCTANN